MTIQNTLRYHVLDCVWNMMAHAQKPDFVFRAKRTSPFKLPGGGGQFRRLLQAEVCASAVVMLDKPCSEVVWRVLATHCIRQFPIHFPSRASPCAITFQLESTMTWEGPAMSPQVPCKSKGQHLFSLLVFTVCSSGCDSGLGWASILLWCLLILSWMTSLT